MGRDVPGGGCPGIGWEWKSGETGLTGLGKRLGPGVSGGIISGSRGVNKGIHNGVLSG